MASQLMPALSLGFGDGKRDEAPGIISMHVPGIVDTPIPPGKHHSRCICERISFLSGPDFGREDALLFQAGQRSARYFDRDVQDLH
jgi:hypothetical protein